MEKRYLIDTNAIIDAQMGNLPENGMELMRNIVNKEFLVSFISYIEFLGYNNISPQSEAFIGLANVIEINKEIIATCIKIRKSIRINLPDAIIASTALVNNLIIVSRNIKDFENIEGLQIIDPFNL